jgi:molybdopterin molybdotransferase
MDDSALGLDGLLGWSQARLIAYSAGRPLPFARARLDEASGSLLGEPIVSLVDEPSTDVAEFDGFAVCASGPWTITELAPDVALPPHYAMKVRSLEPIPPHTDAVLPVSQAVVEEGASDDIGIDTLIARDALNGTPDENVRPDLGTGIIRQAAIATAGRELVSADTLVTPQVISLAAAAGYDQITICRPPVVTTLVIGGSLLDRGVPRGGRVRDSLGLAVPAFVGALGARGNPPVRAPETRDLLLQEIDDSTADLIITTGSTAPGGNNLLRNVLRDLAAHWLIDGVTMTPGAQVLLARLPDGRLLLGLPGDPRNALAALLTVAPPLIAGLRGETWQESTSTAVLIEEAPLPDYAEDTTIVPVTVQITAAGRTANPLPRHGPAGLAGWAQATDFAVIPPGSGAPGDVVPTISVTGT